MVREKKLLYNTSISLLHQVITLVCGFILPRFILQFYGSEVNGLVSSITQFLGFISLAECGVGAVVQSALYKPLAEKDEEGISKIIISSDRFFRKVAFLLIGYTIILLIAYPLITLKSFDYFYTASLILVISISSFAQYFFSMTYRILLNADQLSFIQLSIQSATLILNTFFSVIMMERGASVQSVKLLASLLFLFQPVFLTWYVKRHYNINKKLILIEEPIKQKWNGLAQHIATVVLENTDTAVLTLFSSLENVSIYTVYRLVVNGVKQIVLSMTTGMQSLLGNMYAKNETKALHTTFAFLEWLLHAVTVFVFTSTSLLIIPFVKVYTHGITDVNYIVPYFALLITLAQAAYCLRLPYNMMVLAAGHYKQTQWSAIIEAIINIVISVTLVINWGLVGVAIGTLVAMLYRTTYLAKYLSQNILHRPFKHYIKHMGVDALCMAIAFASMHFLTFEGSTYVKWFLFAIIITCINMVICVIINIIFYKKEILLMVSIIKKKLRI